MKGFFGPSPHSPRAVAWLDRDRPSGAPTALTSSSERHAPILQGWAEHVRADSRTTVLVSGSPRLAIEAQSDGSTTDHAEVVLRAFHHYGPNEFLLQLKGPFAIGICDLDRCQLFLAVDRMGIQRLTYAFRDDCIAFATDARVTADSPCASTSLDPQSIQDYLILNVVPSPRTIYSHVSKLPAATVATFLINSRVVRRYWQPRFAETMPAPRNQMHHALRAELRDAVQRCDLDNSTGAFLSGGLDSSSVVGFMTELSPQPVQTFSIGFGHSEHDELEYARIASSHFATVAREYQATASDIIDTFPQIAAAYDEPFGNSSAVPTLLCARLARRAGVTRLLAGDGGDELFAGNERYAKQLAFERYCQLPPLVRHLFMDGVAGLISKDSKTTILRKFRSFVDQARIPLPDRLESWNYVVRTGIAEMLHPDLLAVTDIGATFQTLRATYHAASSSNTLNRMLYYDWQLTLADNDLRKVTTMCQLAGVHACFPMLDERVVDLSLLIPAKELMAGGRLRGFYKDAMHGFLPDQIVRKRKHGFGLPFSEWLHNHHKLADMVFAYMADLKLQRFVRTDFIDRLMTQYRASPSSYLAYPIWSLAMLSAWLSQRRQNI